MKKLVAISLLLGLLLCGCNVAAPVETEKPAQTEPTKSTQATQETTPAVKEPSVQYNDPQELFSDRDYRTSYEADAEITLNGNSATVSGKGASVSGSVVTVSKKGTYVIRGSLENGQIIVDTDKDSKVQLVLENATIHCRSSAAIYVRQADKVFLTLPEGTENTLSSGETYVAIDENDIDSVIFSKEDLTLNGSGSLLLQSPGGHGIVSKDEMTLTGGAITVQCAGHGLSGKDNVCIDGAALTIQAGKDGIQCDHDEDSGLGFVCILSGTFQIEAEGDGISASGTLEILGGSFDILTGGGWENGEVHTDDFGPGFGGGRPGGMGGGKPGSSQGGNANQTTEDSISNKGLKSGGGMALSGGSFLLNCADDAVHGNENVTVSGGVFQIATGDDGFHADNALQISQGTITITESYEGLEGQSIEISGGAITLKASDDGLNAAGGNDGSGMMGGRPGGDMFAVNENCLISISGGVLFVDAAGDGIDSNGHLTVTGGDVTVEGPTAGANGPLDYNGEGKISDGTLRVTGSVQMAQGMQGIGQGVLGVSVGTIQGGTYWEVIDSEGNVILSGQPAKTYQCIVISSPNLISGQTYTLNVGELSGQLQAQ